MDIKFINEKLRKECNDRKALVKRQGQRRADVIRRRLDDLAAADVLEVMRTLPGRCHELSGNRKGQISIDLDGPYRLLFSVADDPLPVKGDGGLDWSQVKAIIILGVDNTHE